MQLPKLERGQFLLDCKKQLKTTPPFCKISFASKEIHDSPPPPSESTKQAPPCTKQLEFQSHITSLKKDKTSERLITPSDLLHCQLHHQSSPNVSSWCYLWLGIYVQPLVSSELGECCACFSWAFGSDGRCYCNFFFFSAKKVVGRVDFASKSDADKV